MAQNDWKELVLAKLDSIEKKLDTKVDKELCDVKCDGKLSFKQWILLLILICSLISGLFGVIIHEIESPANKNLIQGGSR